MVASLEETPTWAVATVCAILVTISLLLEHGLNLLTKFFQRNRRRSLNQALYKIKSELMLLGFISLLLTISQRPVSKICIPKSVGKTFLPCQNSTIPSDVVEESICQKKGKVSLLSREGVQELQILIFVLALFHVLSCVLTFGLGMAKMRRWEYWEAETRRLEYQFNNDPRRFRLTHQTSFGRRHLKCWNYHRLLRWPACFLRQFNGSVSKADYLTLRHGFIMAHFSEGSNFDFQKFLKRALDDDFHVVVGMSLRVWIFSVFFIFFHAHGFYNYFWLPFIPLVMLLLVGTKLQVIITKMCLASGEVAPVVKGTFLVKPSDDFFWFSQPRFLLHLIHFILFQNSFQLAFFTWTWMGSSMNKAVFTERVLGGLKNWHDGAKRNIATSKTNLTAPSPDISISYTVDTSVSGGQEFESKEAEKIEPEMNDQGSYNGEISFRNLDELIAELPEDSLPIQNQNSP
ncbi:MLO-like protein 12 isoform X2 [Telopea speciosissima]|uniref:MLO-like protein 12 isoform X2 n=1 Tax=Telopea speciosissima TaxID=54955 RepID=UPI001CC4EA8F|nr:MLO-like protein 12 isoform X2 [Telopea speciosissima]